jgi:D-beta-D-heptose 7-phosphate kinase/D-beta-D-heptose 1-phosphate adenosyltransferase
MLTRLVEKLPRPRIFVIGDVMLDRYVWGSVQRISPEAPIQVLNAEREDVRPGGAANVARNLAALGARVECAGAVGADPAGAKLAGLLRSDGIRTALARSRTRETPVKTRMIAHSQQVLRVDHESTHSIEPSLQKTLLRTIRAAARRCDAAVISDYNKGTMAPAVAAAVVRAFRGKPVLVGMKTPHIAHYRGATVAMLNRQELEQFTGVRGEEKAARLLRRRLGLKLVVGTLGERGLMVLGAGPVLRMPTVAREVYDVTGAGDSCLAGFALCYAAGLPTPECAAVANAAAGIVVAKVGTAAVTRDELLQLSHKIVSPKQLAAALDRSRRIVFTNGCFDLLHPGHLNLLQFARSQGDVLVVGINSDASVRSIKGPGRPVMRQNDRARMLAALEGVDYVTIFNERTPDRLIRTVRPNVLVKGADWKGKVVGEEFIKRRGGRVALAPILDGYSTTKLLNR